MATKLDLVMLVDDNDTDNFINERLIQITDFATNIEIKNSGKSALEYLEKHQNDREKIPDLIFLDINMPIVSGFSFLYEFENMPETIKNVSKVVVLTSSDDKRDIDRIVANDYVQKFITKPLSEQHLKDMKNII